MTENIKIPKRILGTLLNSASSGVVSRVGLEYIAIGRNEEIAAVLRDMENIALGMGTFRFIVGKYGSGKSFLMGLIRQNAIEKGFVTCDCDLSPERRFQGTHGQGVATFKELMKNLSCKGMTDQNALTMILSSWLNSLKSKAIIEHSLSQDDGKIDEFVRKSIFETFEKIRGFVNGFDFASVLNSYYEGQRCGNEELTSAAVKWLRGEFSQKSELSGTGLKVKTIIDDHNWYDFLKLYSVFLRAIGYKGLLVFIDECVNLYKISNRVSRENNYEKILSMFNDTMQGKAEGIGFFLGATPQLIEDPRRGLFSYDALRSRLEKGKFTPEGKRNLLSPLIYLEKLTDNELFALCKRLVGLHSLYYSYAPKLCDKDIELFLNESLSKIGADELITPREISRDFLNILDLMFSDGTIKFSDIVKREADEKKIKETNKTSDFDEFFNIESIKP